MFLAVGNVVLATGTSAAAANRGLLRALPGFGALLLVLGCSRSPARRRSGCSSASSRSCARRSAPGTRGSPSSMLRLLAIIFVGMAAMILGMVAGPQGAPGRAPVRESALARGWARGARRGSCCCSASTSRRPLHDALAGAPRGARRDARRDDPVSRRSACATGARSRSASRALWSRSSGFARPSSRRSPRAGGSSRSSARPTASDDAAWSPSSPTTSAGELGATSARRRRALSGAHARLPAGARCSSARSPSSAA